MASFSKVHLQFISNGSVSKHIQVFYDLTIAMTEA